MKRSSIVNTLSFKVQLKNMDLMRGPASDALRRDDLHVQSVLSLKKGIGQIISTTTRLH